MEDSAILQLRIEFMQGVIYRQDVAANNHASIVTALLVDKEAFRLAYKEVLEEQNLMVDILSDPNGIPERTNLSPAGQHILQLIDRRVSSISCAYCGYIARLSDYAHRVELISAMDHHIWNCAKRPEYQMATLLAAVLLPLGLDLDEFASGDVAGVVEAVEKKWQETLVRYARLKACVTERGTCAPSCAFSRHPGQRIPQICDCWRKTALEIINGTPGPGSAAQSPVEPSVVSE